MVRVQIMVRVQGGKSPETGLVTTDLESVPRDNLLIT